jgi:hypothetical protein
MPQTVEQQSAGYWSQVEDFGTNPPPAGYDSGGEATFYPYVQTPRGYDDYGAYGAYGGYGGYGYYGGGVAGFDEAYGPYGVAPPGFGSLYYTSFYGMNPYLYGRPIVVPSPGVTPVPRPRPTPPPASKPPPHPVTSKPPRPPVTGPAPSPRATPPPRTGSDRGAKPSRP